MEHALRTRAISFAAASGVCGLALFALAGMQFHYALTQTPDAPRPVDGYVEPDPPPPPEPKPETNQQPLRDAWPEPAPLDAPELTQRLTELTFDAERRPYQFGGGGALEVTHPHWLNRPQNLARYYPPRAVRRGVEGQARIECIVDTQGWLGNCTILSETPAGWGFGQAAQRIAREHQMSPALRDGVPVTARYRMIVPFDLE